MKLLAVETATAVCGAAVAEGERVLAEVNLDLGRVHAERLAAVVHWLLEIASWEPVEVDVVAVSAGPGSFTGLRIGFAFAKGFALPHEARLVTVPTLEAIAYNAVNCSGTVCSILRSRRGEFYAARYRGGTDGLTELSAPAVVEEEALADFCLGSDAVVGQTDALPEATAKRLAQEGVVVWPPHAGKTRAGHVAVLGSRLAAQSRWADLETAEPQYLQEFVARLPGERTFGKRRDAGR